MKAYLLVFILIFSTSSLATLEISEVMYDFPGSDSGHEWIEIYNSGLHSINLTGWKLIESGKTHSLSLVEGNFTLNPLSFAIIADNSEKFLLDNNSSSILFDSSFSLSNSGEEIMFKSGDLSFNISYNTSLGAKGNGKTLCILNHTWQECSSTPGEYNQIYSELPIVQNLILSTYLDDRIFAYNTYKNLFKIKIEDKSCSEKDNVTVYYNISGPNVSKEDVFTKKIGCSSYAATGEFTPVIPGNYTLCGQVINSTVNEDNFLDNSDCMVFEVTDPYAIECEISIQIDTEQTLLYNKGDSIKFKHILNNESFPYIIEYWVEDLFGNIVKNKYNTTNTNQKSWKTNIDEEDRVLFIKSLVHPSCNDFNKSNNFAEEMFIVIRNEFSTSSDSSLDENVNSAIVITKISPQEISFGKLLKVNLEIYKNSTNKYSLSAWVEKDGKSISEKTKINLKNKNTEYKVTLPIQLKPNCDGKITEGEAVVVIEGLGEKAEKQVSITGINKGLCKDTAAQTSNKKSSNNPSYEVEVPSTINPGDAFSVTLKITNGNNEHDYEVWSYLYRGSKCYSCSGGKERDDNLESFDLEENEQKEIKLKVKADQDLEEGEYKLKVKIRKDNQKTTKDFTEKIHIKTEEEAVSYEEDSLIHFSKSSQQDPSDTEKERIIHQGGGIVIYESSSEKAKKLIPSLLAVTFALLSLTFVFRKK